MAARCCTAIFFFCLLPLGHHYDQCRDSYLLSVINKTEGIEITLVPDSGRLDAATQDKTYEVLSLPYFASPECGKQGFRCSSITTFVTKQPHRYIALIPLLNYLSIVDVNVLNMSFHSETALFTETCSPTAVFPILQSLYTVCVNSSTRDLYVYEVRVDTVDITKSYLTAALAQVTLEDPPELSNYVFVDLGRQSDYQRIYFTTGSSMYALIPLSPSFSYVGSVDNCKLVYNLVYLGEWVILAYCSDGSLLYFDLQEEAVVTVEDAMVDGNLLVCLNSAINVRVYHSDGSSHIEYSLDEESDKRRVYDLPGANYHSGVCFAAENTSVFMAFVDSLEGVFVLDLLTYNLFQVSHEPCPGSTCQPLLVINSTYLVIQKESAVSVVYREGNNLSLEIITAPHQNANLLTIIEWQHQCSESPSVTAETPTDQHHNTAQEVIIASTSAVAGLIITLVLVIIACIIYRKVSKTQQYPVQESDSGNPISLVITNARLSPSPILMGKTRSNGSGQSDSEQVSSSATSIAASRPENALNEEYNPTSLEMVDHGITFSTEPSSPSMSTTTSHSEIEPGMDAIKTTCV